jgi:hypothetical protein
MPSEFDNPATTPTSRQGKEEDGEGNGDEGDQTRAATAELMVTLCGKLLQSLSRRDDSEEASMAHPKTACVREIHPCVADPQKARLRIKYSDEFLAKKNGGVGI